MKPRSIFFITFRAAVRCLAVLFLLASSGCGTKPAATTVAAVTAVQSTATLPPTDTPQPTATNTAAPTATATATPLPTATNTPVPTATPEGYIRDSNFGLSFVLPKGWKLQKQAEDGVTVTGRQNHFVVVFTSMAEAGTMTLDEIVQEMQKSLKMSVSGKSQMELDGGIQADVVETLFTENGQQMDMWLTHTHQGARGYLFYVMGQPNALKKYRDEIAEGLITVKVFRPTLYDLPQEETLTLLGGDPLPEELDPATTTSSAGDYSGLLFSGLVRLDKNLQIVPDLAESWKINSDGTVYTFTLRAGLKFANGDPITAEDVRKSWERALDPATKSTTAATYLGDIQGAKDKLGGKAKEVSGLKVIDEHTLEVTLDGPKMYFLAKLTYPTSFVIDTRQPAKDAKKWMVSPNSSGPFVVKKYEEKKALLFERSANYFQPAGVKNILFILNPGGSPLSLYEEGTLDVLGVSYADMVEMSKPDNAHNKELFTSPSMCTTMLALNTNLAPTNDPLVRKALFLATDRGQWIDKLTSGQGLQANGILPPSMPGYQADRALPQTDAAAAKEALSQSTYAGKPLNITISASGYAGDQRKDVALLADQWQKALGAKVTVDLVDPEKYTETVRKKPGNVIISGWCADYPDPENFLDLLFHTGSDFNYTNSSDPELDALLDKARVALDPAERIALYQQAEARILDQYMAIPVSNGTGGMLIHARVKNYVQTAIGTKNLAEVTFQP